MQVALQQLAPRCLYTEGLLVREQGKLLRLTGKQLADIDPNPNFVQISRFNAIFEVLLGRDNMSIDQRTEYVRRIVFDDKYNHHLGRCVYFRIATEDIHSFLVQRNTVEPYIVLTSEDRSPPANYQTDLYVHIQRGDVDLVKLCKSVNRIDKVREKMIILLESNVLSSDIQQIFRKFGTPIVEFTSLNSAADFSQNLLQAMFPF